ncbi:MAG: adenylyltransferase/cytidyltransferase family protein [Poseidonia sp.]
MTRCIVLGRFQPFHLGHAGLVKEAVEHADGGEVVVAIGSAQAGWEANNPWTADERQSMIEAWASEEDVHLSIVQIEDINDPPKWVAHATKTHGTGTLVTSDGPTMELYRAAGWDVHETALSERETLEGWRVRQSIRMLSTVMDDEATRTVLAASVPSAVIEWLIENDAMFRCSTFETGVHAG